MDAVLEVLLVQDAVPEKPTCSPRERNRACNAFNARGQVLDKLVLVLSRLDLVEHTHRGAGCVKQRHRAEVVRVAFWCQIVQSLKEQVRYVSYIFTSSYLGDIPEVHRDTHVALGVAPRRAAPTSTRLSYSEDDPST